MKITSQNDVGYLMTLAVITITSVLEFLKYIITVLPIRLTVILMIMSVSTFKTDVILCLIKKCILKTRILSVDSESHHTCTLMYIFKLSSHFPCHLFQKQLEVLSTYVLYYFTDVVTYRSVSYSINVDFHGQFFVAIVLFCKHFFFTELRQSTILWSISCLKSIMYSYVEKKS